MLCEVIRKVFSSLLQVQAELILLDAAVHPVETHVKVFGALPEHVAGEEVTVSFLIGVGGCGWTVSVRAVQMGTSCWQLMTIAPVSASAAEAIRVWMV